LAGVEYSDGDVDVLGGSAIGKVWRGFTKGKEKDNDGCIDLQPGREITLLRWIQQVTLDPPISLIFGS
jgi:hypothetical protein